MYEATFITVFTAICLCKKKMTSLTHRTEVCFLLKKKTLQILNRCVKLYRDDVFFCIRSKVSPRVSSIIFKMRSSRIVRDGGGQYETVILITIFLAGRITTKEKTETATGVKMISGEYVRIVTNRNEREMMLEDNLCVCYRRIL